MMSRRNHFGWTVPLNVMQWIIERHDPTSSNAFTCLSCVPSQIRLTGGRTRLEGRVELLHSGGSGVRDWGLICGDGWTSREAMVVCRQLGLGHASSGLRVRRTHIPHQNTKQYTFSPSYFFESRLIIAMASLLFRKRGTGTAVM